MFSYFFQNTDFVEKCTEGENKNESPNFISKTKSLKRKGDVVDEDGSKKKSRLSECSQSAKTCEAYKRFCTIL